MMMISSCASSSSFVVGLHMKSRSSCLSSSSSCLETTRKKKKMKGRWCSSFSCSKNAGVVQVLAALLIFVISPPAETTLSNVPQTLSPPDDGGGKQSRIQRPRSREAEYCTIKCVTTCIRSGTGEGPLNVRRPLVVFKDGFRSRHYCLVECSDICNLIKDGWSPHAFTRIHMSYKTNKTKSICLHFYILALLAKLKFTTHNQLVN